MVDKRLNEQQLKAICCVLAKTDKGLTKKELTSLLVQCQIALNNDGQSSNGFTYTVGLNKRDWLFNCFVNEINTYNSYERIFNFIEKALDPINYTGEASREKYRFLFEELNKVLLFIGLNISSEGRLIQVSQAKSLDEVDRRVSNLRRHLYNRAIHHEVEKYCIKDYLRNDYYDAVFEAVKGLADRVRDITGLSLDGTALFRKAFDRNHPYVFFNKLETDTELNEFLGLKELLEAIIHLVRNPAAHTPKINWKKDETYALDVLTIISFVHKYLDECHRVPRL